MKYPSQSFWVNLGGGDETAAFAEMPLGGVPSLITLSIFSAICIFSKTSDVLLTQPTGLVLQSDREKLVPAADTWNV